MHTHSPREHAWLKGAQPRIAHWCVKITCHPSVMSHPLQHLSLSTSARSLSPHLSSDLLLPHCPVLWNWIHMPCEIHGRVADPLKSHLPHDAHRVRLWLVDVPDVVRRVGGERTRCACNLVGVRASLLFFEASGSVGGYRPRCLCDLATNVKDGERL